MEDHARDRIKDISRMDIVSLVDDLVVELHLDCSKKVDPEVFKHTTDKFTKLLVGQFSSWYWGEILSVTRMGISGSYGAFNDKINFQALFSWMRKAQQLRSVNYADKSIEEARQLSNMTVGDYRSISMRWKEFREYLEGYRLWFVDNISERNCERYHEAKMAGTLKQFRQELAVEPDPEYLVMIRQMTLEQFKNQAHVEEVFN